jgi:hypothetical protein
VRAKQGDPQDTQRRPCRSHEDEHDAQQMAPRVGNRVGECADVQETPPCISRNIGCFSLAALLV